MLVHIDNVQSDVSLDLSNLPLIISQVLKTENARCDEIAIHFVTSQKISVLHKKFFNDSSVTDCITLPLDDPDEDYCILGDVFVCPKTAKKYVEKEGGDLYEEITLYVIHGILHLLGYDDLDEDEEVLMRAAEVRNLKHIKKLGVILSSGNTS